MGLLKTAAKTAVITSTATRVHGRNARRQQARWAEQTAAQPAPVAAPPPAPAAAAGRDTSAMLGQLRDLGDLRSAGVLTDAEFEVQKARILHGA